MRKRLGALGGSLVLLLSATLGAGQEGGCVDCLGGPPVMDYDKPPKPIRMTRPQYPRAAFDSKIEGTVVVEILIDEKGRVHPRRILTSSPALDAAAVETVKQWLFSPAIKKGHPVASIAHAPIGFRLFDKPTDHPAKPPAPAPPPLSGTDTAPQQSLIADESGPVAHPSPSPAVPLMGGLYFDPEGADFTAWINQWKTEVYRNWIVPQPALLGFRGHSDIEFTVERDGNLSGTRVQRSAGQPSLDRAAENALLRGRFLPLPEDFHSPRVTIAVSFFYNEGPQGSGVPTP